MGSTKKLGLTKAIMISVVITTTVALLMLTITGFFTSYSKVKEGIFSTTEQSLNVYSEEVNQWLTRQAEFTAAQANAAGKLGEISGGHQNNDAFLDSVMPLNDALLDCYTAYEDVSLYMAVTDTTTLPEGFDATTRGWYQDAKKSKTTIFTAPYIDTATGRMIITVASPLYENGKFAGVFACDITLDSVMQIVGEMKITENGYPVLIDNDGNFMIHGNEEYNPAVADGNAVITSSADIEGDYSAVLSSLSEEIYLDTHKDYDGKQKYFAFTKLPVSNWSMGYIMPESDINSGLVGLGVTYVILFIVFFVVANAVVMLVMKAQMKPLKEINEVAEKIADGNLSARFDYRSDDEIGQLCGNFMECTEITRHYISEISDKLDRLSNGDFTVKITEDYKGDFRPIKESLLNITDSMRRTLEHIGNASVQVNMGAARMAESSTVLAQGVSNQTNTIKKLTDDMTSVIEQVKETEQRTFAARELAGNAKKKIETSSLEMDKLLSAMNEISNMSSEISKIMKTIDDIAFQTNILALNASVEAARAGEAGKGFTVVAEEVRMLASKSAEAAKRTSDLLSQTEIAINEGVHLADSTAKALSDAVSDTVSVDENIIKIAETTKNESEFMDNIFTSINAISGIVETTSDSAQSGAASSEELSSQATILSHLISEFKI
ncbi:MAG: methyl-accepting chemotaxis protein [Oscillospiraceae bacterium]|nr:methyl-accepting chemotaxis protein [Oscillospiraceae bacterium]